MKNTYIVRVALIIMISSMVFGRPALAENRAAQYLIKSGIRELDKGNEKGAICQFRKAIMVEPNNEEAHLHLSHLGASPNALSDSPRRKLRMADQANQSLKEYQQKVTRLNTEINQMLFRLERVQHEREQDRYSYLDMDNHQQNNVIQPVETVIYVRQAPTLPASRPLYTKNEYGHFDQGGYHDLQTLVDDSSRNELDFHQWINPNLESKYYDQFVYQDKLIQLLDDYLDEREIELQSAKDDLIHTQIDLSQTQKDLAVQVKSKEQLNDLYDEVLKKGEGHAFYISEENNYMGFLETKQDDLQNQLIQKAAQLKQRDIQLACLEEELEQTQQKISNLMNEREQLLNSLANEGHIILEKDSSE
ncbi:MAG: hypothetical protein KBD53_01015 [Candidatus Omnitrophica bacterium]|nr:hypothetical protein [Candidatus Omnitrophota bacterium]